MLLCWLVTTKDLFKKVRLVRNRGLCQLLSIVSLFFFISLWFRKQRRRRISEPYKVAVLAQEAIQGSNAVTRRLLEGIEVNNIAPPPMRGHCLLKVDTILLMR